MSTQIKSEQHAKKRAVGTVACREKGLIYAGLQQGTCCNLCENTALKPYECYQNSTQIDRLHQNPKLENMDAEIKKINKRQKTESFRLQKQGLYTCICRGCRGHTAYNICISDMLLCEPLESIASIRLYV